MNRSEQINELVVALIKAQAAFEPIYKETENPAFRSKYADLSTIISATRPALNANGLVLIQGVECVLETQATKIETLLAHVSGQWISDELHLPATMRDRFDAQAVGSSQTYGRRYAMQAMLGVAADVDDDGNGASGITAGTKEAAQAVAQQKIAQLQAKVNGSAAKPPIKPKPPQDTASVIRISYPPELRGDAVISGGGTANLELALQMSLHGSKEGDGKWRLPGGAVIKFYDVCRAEGIAVIDTATGDVTETKAISPLPKIADVKRGSGKAAGCVFVKWDGEELSCWDTKLHPYLVVGQPADFEVKTTKSGGKTYNNITHAVSIGNTKFDSDNKPMLDVDREIPEPPHPPVIPEDIEEYTL